MTTDQQIENELRNVRFAVPPEQDRLILADALAALSDQQHGARRFKLPVSRVYLLRRAAMILLPLATLALVVLYFQRPSLTLADVRDAVARQKWVHIRYDNGQERWINLVNGHTFFKDYDGSIAYTEPNGLYLSRWPEKNYIDKHSGLPFQWSKETAWGYLVADVAKASKEKSSWQIVDQKSDVLDRAQSNPLRLLHH